ncbi:MAG: ParM/StbA family protein [Bacillota bacterium]|nr:ParM/StbA family protein [Bacillota bacterium]
MSLGIDLGNKVVKTSEMKKFDSRVANGHFDLNKNDIKVEYEGKKYTVGTGTAVLGNDRYFNKLYDICLLTAIAMSSDAIFIEENIVIGMPPELFESDLKDEVENKLNSIGLKNITVNGVAKSIRILKANVFEESAIVFRNTKEYRDKRVLVIDIGGGTADISQFKNLELEKSTTTKYGMLSLYENMKKAINTKYLAKLTSEDMVNLINKDFTIIKGNTKDISFTKDIIQEHVMKIYNEVQNFDYDNSKILIIGGGALPLSDYFRRLLPYIEIPADSQFTNALTYERVGEMLNGRK